MEGFLAQWRWLEGEPDAVFLLEGWAKQACALGASAGWKVAGMFHLHSFIFCMSLWAEARLREETTSGPGCQVSATTEWAQGATCFLSREPAALLSVNLLGKHRLLHVCWDMLLSSAPSPLLFLPPS